MRAQILLVLATSLISTSAAAVTLSEYQAQRVKNRVAVNAYLEAVGNGFTWANASLESTKREKLYCAPRRLALNGENYNHLLNEYLKLGIDMDTPDTPIEMLLMNALQHDFPCNP
jgi:hypothetical protein